MAFPLSQKALRAVQDALPLHQALRCEHAPDSSMVGVCKKGMHTCGYSVRPSLQSNFGRLHLVARVALADPVGLEVDVLFRGCWMGKGAILEGPADSASCITGSQRIEYIK